MTRKYTLSDIHAELDGYHSRPFGWSREKGMMFSREFPGYEAVNDVPVAWRMNVFADDSRWAILFEEVGVDPWQGAVGYGGASNIVRGIGPGARRNSKPPQSKVNFFDPLDRLEDGDPSFINNEIDGIYASVIVRSGVTSVRVRGVEQAITSTAPQLKSAGLEQEDRRALQAFELLRMVEHDHPGVFFADAAQLRTCLTSGLPLLLSVDEWCHPTHEEAPSSCEALQLVSEVILTGDPSRYKPTLKPNTDWRIRPYVSV